MNTVTTESTLSTTAETPRWLRPLAMMVAIHGLTHLVGTVRKLREASDGDTADYLGGWWEITDATMLRTLAVIWAAVAVLVIAAAVTIWRQTNRWPQVLFAVTLVSLVLTVLSLWSAIVGVAVNIALLAIAVLAMTQRIVTQPRTSDKGGIHGNESPQ